MSEELKNGRYDDGNGIVEWLVNGELHREDGPAIVRKGGSKEWWMNGKKYSEEEFSNWLSKKKFAEKLTEQLEEKPTGKRVKI